VAALNLVLAASLELQHLKLRPAQVLHDLARYLGLRGIRAAENFLVVRTDGDDVIEGHLSADLALEPLDLDRLARGYAILLSSTANYGVHAASKPV